MTEYENLYRYYRVVVCCFDGGRDAKFSCRGRDHVSIFWLGTVCAHRLADRQAAAQTSAGANGTNYSAERFSGRD